MYEIKPGARTPRAALVCAVVVFVASPVWGQGRSTIAWTFDRSELRIEQQGEYTQVALRNGVMPEQPPGTPALPGRLVFVVIPAGAAPTLVSVEAVEESLAQDVLLWPAQPLCSSNDAPAAFVPPDPAAYASDQPTPGAWADVTGTHRLHGFTLVSLRLNALRYVPARRELSLATRIDVTLSYGEPDPRQTDKLRSVPRGPAAVAQLVANPQDVERFAPPGDPGAPRDESAVYLLITNTDLAAAFQPLVDRRTAQGKPGTLLTTEWIYANYDGTRPDGGTDDQTKIRNCIIDYYQNHGTVWVCLGGDESVIPLRYGYCYNVSAWPADLYYADLDGTWDGNANGKYAEPGYEDDVDYVPEVWVGRIPIRPAAAPDDVGKQAADYVAKLINYESRSPDGFSHSMFLTTDANWYQSGLNRPSDFQEHDPVWGGEIIMRRFYRDYVQPDWQAAPLYEYYRTLTSFDEVYCGDYARTDHLRELLNLGAQHFLYCCDGNQQAIGSANGVLDVWMASTLNNADRPGIYYIVACSTAALQDVDPTLCESLLRNPDGGAVAYVGATNAIGATTYWAQSFYFELFHNGRATIGEAFGLHKLAWLANSHGDNDDHKHQFIINLFGDPALLAQGGESGRHLQVLSPRGCEVIDSDADMTIRWNAHGAAFEAGDTVQLGYSADAGTTWLLVPGAGAVPYDGRRFVWENPVLTPGAQYRIRVTATADPAASAMSERNFTIGPTRILTVNSTPMTGLWITGTHENTTNYTYCPLVGSGISLKAPSVTGYNFAGWLDANGNLLARQTLLSFVLSGNKTITASYAPIGPARDYYVNDDTAETDFAAGDDGNDGLSSATPIRHIQEVVDRCRDIATIHVSAGTYVENVRIGSAHSGFGLQGAGAESTIIDGNQTGPCIYLNSVSSAAITGLTLRNGRAEYGGGIGCDFSSPTISNCKITGNTGTVHGGGMFVVNSSPTITGCTIADNLTPGQGGGIEFAWGYPVITDSVITGNSAGYGGGIFCGYASSPQIARCAISSNQATVDGGGVYGSTATVTVVDCALGGNHAEYGGGAAYIRDGDISLSALEFSENSARWGGAVCKAGSGTGVIANCVFDGNSVTSNGGAIHLSSSEAVAILDNHLSGNHTEYDGGAIDLWNSSATLANNVIYDNSAAEGGAGIAVRGASGVVMANDTVYWNTAATNGGGLRVSDSSTVQAGNCIFWNNSAPAGRELRLWGQAVLAIGYCDVDGGSAAASLDPSASLSWLVGNIDVGPQFVDSNNGNLRLEAASPCIDAGDPDFTPQPGETDLDGRCRVWDGNNDGVARVDMGAYEFGTFPYGDLNCDGLINGLDVQAFVLAMFDPVGYAGTYPECHLNLADVNSDGVVDMLDVAPFVALLAGGQ